MNLAARAADVAAHGAAPTVTTEGADWIPLSLLKLRNDPCERAGCGHDFTDHLHPFGRKPYLPRGSCGHPTCRCLVYAPPEGR